MTWVYLDDHFTEHPKIAHLSDAAFRGFVEGLCYCARNLTDGRIPTTHAKKLTSAKAVRELMSCGLWVQNGKSVDVHDYLHYQSSRREVEARRAKREAVSVSRAEAGRRGGLQSGLVRSASKTKQT